MTDPRLVEIEILADLDRQALSGERKSLNLGGTSDWMREEALLHLMFDGAIIHADYVRDADEILRGVFQLLRDAVPSDAAYRLGGDEAGALLPNLSLRDAETVGEEVRRTVERTFASKQMPDGATPTVSIGVGTITKRLAGPIFEERVEKLRATAKGTRNTVVAAAVDEAI